MSPPILALRQLNRATLARQMLLEREGVTVPATIERLGGMQAQLSVAPFVGLWTRLREFGRDDLTRLIDNRAVVKATFHRATLHLITTNDYARFRATLQPMLESGWAAVTHGRGEIDLAGVLAAARQFIAEKPRTFAEISATLSAHWPDRDIGVMRYAVRTHLPLVQVPTSAKWSFPGNPAFTLAESWLGRELDTEDQPSKLIRRYLAAFGPASIRDMQTWCGLANLKETFEEMRPELTVYRDENRRELFDLADAPIPDADTPAPARFLPEYDNLLLSHSVRTRVITNEHRARVYLPGLRVRATILVDGFVRGCWSIERKGKSATLTIEPFEEIGKEDRDALAKEAEELVRFVESEAATHEVRIIALG